MSDNAPWADFWLNAQQQFWDSWSSATLNEGKAASGPNPAEFWQRSMQQWWEGMTPGENEAADVYEKMLSAGKNYFDMAETFIENVTGSELNQIDALNEWLESMQCSLMNLSRGETAEDCVSPEFIDYWTAPVDTWKHMAASMSPFQDKLHEGLFDAHKHTTGMPLPESMQQMFSLPAIGLFRESQEEYQALSSLLMNYQTALRAYKVAFAATTAKSLSAVQKRLQGMSKEERESLGSLRDFYNLWVEVFEETYAEFAMSVEYQALYGELVNSLMALQQQAQKLIDMQYQKLNLPSRSEIDALEKRYHQVRRDNFRMRSTISELEARLDALENAKPKPAPRSAVTKKKATPKKKAAVKKTVTKKRAMVKKKAATKKGGKRA